MLPAAASRSGLTLTTVTNALLLRLLLLVYITLLIPQVQGSTSPNPEDSQATNKTVPVSTLTPNTNVDDSNYAPKRIACPAYLPETLLREATTISKNESAWLQRRSQVTTPALYDFLLRATENFEDNSFLNSTLFNLTYYGDRYVPKLGIAFSGGGYRAMLTGAGILAAMDNRTRGSMENGLGGLLQAMTYIAGVSGGNWLVGSLAWNDWVAVQEIMDNWNDELSDFGGGDDNNNNEDVVVSDGSGVPIWDLHGSVIAPGGLNIIKTARWWEHIVGAIQAKADAGFNPSLTDLWGRVLSYIFFPHLERGGIDYSWSSLRESPVFQSANMPFPISVSDGRYPGTTVINLNSTLFEFNPFEMGSWDPSLNAFFDVKYLGTNVSNGVPIVMQTTKSNLEGLYGNDTSGINGTEVIDATDGTAECVLGYDNTAFIMATSSTLFNEFLLQINNTDLSHIPNFVVKIATSLLNELSRDYNDIAVYSPNPFKGSRFAKFNMSSTNSIAESDSLYLVDGGEDDENIPLAPLIRQDRGLDIVFAVDNSADIGNWPNGNSLLHTYERQFYEQGENMAFPYIPDTDTMVNLGLNRRPTFFGCEAANLTDLKYIPPLVVYLPNSRYSFDSNQSAFRMSYSETERRQMIANGYEIATRNNFTDDPDFLGCIGCAIIRRKQELLNLTLPIECESCFINYCWDGTLMPSSDNNGGNGEGEGDSATEEKDDIADMYYRNFTDGVLYYMGSTNPDRFREPQYSGIFHGFLGNLKVIIVLLTVATFAISLL